MKKEWRGVGGTPGGLKHFVIGMIMLIIGGYLLLNQVTVHSGFWSFVGFRSFGISLLPFLFGIGFLFFNGKSIVGWFLTIAGLLVIFAGILSNLSIYFRPASLFETLIMLILLVGGAALVFRSLKSLPSERDEQAS